MKQLAQKFSKTPLPTLKGRKRMKLDQSPNMSLAPQETNTLAPPMASKPRKFGPKKPTKPKLPGRRKIGTTTR